MYTTGRGVQQHHGDAVIWFRRAAEQGFARAQYNLAVMYLDGLGVEQDSSAAVTWYRQAAVRGYVPAQYSLGVQYFRGTGVTQDSVLAYVWISIAATNGNDDAFSVRNTIARQLSDAELAVAEEVATRCREQGYEFCVR